MRDNKAFVLFILITGLLAIAGIVLFLALLFGAFGYVLGTGLSSM